MDSSRSFFAVRVTLYLYCNQWARRSDSLDFLGHIFWVIFCCRRIDHVASAGHCFRQQVSTRISVAASRLSDWQSNRTVGDNEAESSHFQHWKYMGLP